MSILLPWIRPVIVVRLSQRFANVEPFEGVFKMLRRFFGCGLLTVLTPTLSLATYGDDKSPPKLPAPPTSAALEKMKRLTGTWLVADKDGKPTDQIASVIKVTAGGSAVH